MMSSQVTNKNGGCYRRISSVASVVSSSLTSTGVVPRRSRLPLGSGGRTAAAGWLAGRRPLQVGEAVNKKKYLSFPNFPISFFFSLYSRARSTHRWVMLSLGYAAILYANTVQGVSIYDPLLHPTPPPSRVCCANLEEPPALMKMGLSMVLVGHVNFLLGALVHGVVLRHINLHKQARAMEYAISNVVALASGLVGIVIGILAIVLSKNKKSRALTWSLFSSSLISSLMASASAIGLLVSVVRAIIHGGRSLLTHCRFPDAVDYSSVTNECPFDPTRIYVKHHSDPLGASHRDLRGPADLFRPLPFRVRLLSGFALLPAHETVERGASGDQIHEAAGGTGSRTCQQSKAAQRISTFASSQTLH
ncbi:transmembrane protein 54b isoform 1-T1 [Syngnathus typhle]